MSSNGDDLDEDALLEIALKEQAQRDTNYRRPSQASKPVVNLVQPPPIPPASRNQRNPNPRAAPTPAMAHKKNPSRGGDDDDDSEVELLSISSGDEDSTKDRVVPQRGAAAGRDRRGERDDGDRAWNGDEPDCWKRVDETDLSRRVREMRDTRAAPSQTLDQKTAAMGRKGLNNLQSFRGVEVLDPLGLGIIDNKSMRLITESSESSPLARDKSDTLDPNLREKVMYYSPNFDPMAFLSRVHHKTSAADLESGALVLKNDFKGRTQQKKQLVKENFDCFVSCKTTIDDIESKLRQIEKDPEGAGTVQLHAATQNITVLANQAFQPLFERQVQADKIRSVQGMLQRFRTLFNLPSSIRGSISRGEYDLAVREYRKAKSIVLPSHAGILKRVLEEVEKVMHEFRGMLYKSMEDPQIDLADLENIVRLLLELEPDSDPVWHYLNIQNRRIQGLLEKCALDHEERMEVLQHDLQERLESDARWRQLQQESNKPLGFHLPTEDSHLEESQPINLIGEEVDSLRGRYIHRLSAVIIHHIPAFWRLSLAVFSGKFAKATTGSMHLDNEIFTKSSTNNGEEKASDIKYSSHSLEEVAPMVHGTISAYEAKVLNTFRDFEESNILLPYMSNSVNEIAKACQALERKETAPSLAVKIMYGLHFEITKIYILRLCTWMRATTEVISKDEMWIPLSTLERNKSPYSISYLPLAFQEMTASAMDRIDVMIENLKSAATKTKDLGVLVEDIQESVRLAFLNSFMDFAGYLEQIGGELTLHRSYGENTQSQMESSTLHSNGAIADSLKKLLVVLSNIGYCKDELSQTMYSKYKHIWGQSKEMDGPNADIKDLITSFSALEEKILGHYTYAKSNLIRSAAINYLLDSGVQWGGAPAVKGIRDATIDLLHTLVAVHAEIFSGVKPLLEKTLGILVEGLIDTLLNLFHDNNGQGLKLLDPNGFCQLMLELEFFETVLHTYFSPAAHEAFKSLQGLLLDKACESATESAENPGHHRRPTRGSEDAMVEEKQQGSVSPDDLLALAQQYSSELLEAELERTRLNIACFMDSSLQPASVPVNPKPTYSSFQGPVSSPSFRRQQTVSSPGFSRHRRR